MTRTLTFLAASLLCMLYFETFAQDYRIIGHRTNRFDANANALVPFDTMTLTYSNGRGGDYDGLFTGLTKPDTIRNLDWNGSAFELIAKSFRLYNLQNFLSELHWTDAAGTSTSRSLYTYDINNNLTLNLYQVWDNNTWEDAQKTITTFDGNNNLLIEERQTWDGSIWEPTGKTLHTYDLNNNLTNTVGLYYNAGVWDTVSLTTYHYTNNLRDTFFQKQYSQPSLRKSAYDYQNGINTKTWDYKWNGSSWEAEYQHFLSYQGTGNIYINDSTTKWNANTNLWEPFRNSIYMLDNNNDAVIRLNRGMNGQTGMMQNSSIDSMKYNNGHKLIWNKHLIWDINTGTWGLGTFARERFYYYEQYTNNIKTLSLNTSNVEIFPSPAKDNINVHVNFETPENFKVQVYDMQGRLVLQLGEKANKEYSRNIPLHELPSGNYILQIAGNKTKAQELFTIIK